MVERGKRGHVLVAGAKRVQVRKVQRRCWTAAKRKRFLEELSATCNVAAALRVVKMSDQSVYQLRRRSAEFRAAWAEALREGYAKLEVMLLDRAMNGTVKTVTRANGAVDKTHEFPNAVALNLLARHKDAAFAAGADHSPEEADELRRRILRKLDAVRRRAEAADTAAGAAE